MVSTPTLQPGQGAVTQRQPHSKRAASRDRHAATMTTQLTPQLARTLVWDRVETLGTRRPPRRSATRWRTGRRARDDLAPDHPGAVTQAS
jgi:hypothetical protein